VSNFAEFTNYIKDPDPIDEKYRSHREKLSNMFHKYKDGNSAERICNIFWPKEDNK
jgi:CDP-glycerol glycerophosphotransferase (TagB/SpsB family)